MAAATEMARWRGTAVRESAATGGAESLLMPAGSKYVGWRLWLWWMLTSSVGWVLGLAAGLAVGFALGGTVSAIASQSAFGAVLGASIGMLQWVVLRRQISGAGWWVLATAVGMGVGFALIRAVTLQTSAVLGGGPLYGLVNGGLVGTLVGAMQWLVVRSQISRAGWWVLASALGAGVGLALDRVAGQIVGMAVTGTALVWLLRRLAPGNP